MVTAVNVSVKDQLAFSINLAVGSTIVSSYISDLIEVLMITFVSKLLSSSFREFIM